MTETTYAVPVARWQSRIISYAWGESYVDELLTFVIPALLAPSNLPYFASQVQCDLTLVTEERFFPKIAAHPVIARVRQFCPLRLVGLDDLVTRADQYGIALTHVLHRAFSDLGPAVTNHWLVFLNADFILADGSLRSLLGHLAGGERIVASPSYCTIKEHIIPELKERLAADPTVLSIPPREMARLILRHCHDTVRGKTVNEDRFHLLQADQFYWQVDDDTLIGHQMPVAIVGMRPERYVREPNSYWDHGLMLEFCPTAVVKVIGDSDDFLMLELRGRGVAENQVVGGLPKPSELAERMIDWVTPYQASFARRPLTLHASYLPATVDQARKRLADYVDEVLSHAPDTFPSHLNHPQWDYHWPPFMKARHAFLTARYEPTKADSPPESMYAVDQLWWRLTAIEKAHARKIELMTGAIREIDRELEAFPRLLAEKLTAPPARSQTTPALYRAMTLEQRASGEQCSERNAASGEVESIVSAVSDVWVRKEKEAHQKKAILRAAIATAESEFIENEGAEYADLKREYEGRIAPRVKSAAFPRVRWRVGNAAPAVSANTIRHTAGTLYRALFGRWPRVTKLSPFWAALQPLLSAIDQAKADGARNLLIVGDHSGIAQRIDDLPGIYGWTSVDGLLSGMLGGVLPQQGLRFDLCIVDLDIDDMPQWTEIVARAKPHMGPGGRIVGFHMNAGRPLTTTVPRIDGETALRITGSAAAVRAIAIFGHAMRPIRPRPLRWVRMVIGLALSAPLALRANRAEVVAAREGRLVAEDVRTSLTITVPHARA